MRWKSWHLIILGLVVFSSTFLASSLLLKRPTTLEASLPISELQRVDALAQKISELLEASASVKDSAIQQLIDSESQGDFHLLYRDWSLKLFKTGEAPPQPNTNFLTPINSSEFRIAVPVGNKQVKGILIATLSAQQPALAASWWLHAWIGLGLTGFVVALALWFKAREMTRPIDRLCQKFTRYRREHENQYLQLPAEQKRQTPLERRLIVLEDLWAKFQFTQQQLANKVEELEHSKRALEQSKQALEKTVHDLELAKEQERRLVELGHALAEFGHDIGNANGAILTFVSLLLRLLEKEVITMEDLAHAIPYIRRIKIASTNISGLITDILEFAKGKTELRPTEESLQNFVDKLDVQFAFAADMPIQYDLGLDGEAILRLDNSKIARVIVNLVKNAWEKLEASEEPLIEIGFHTFNGKNLTISVKDNGSPIPEAIVPRLFQSFQTQGKEQGTGLGLAICKKIVGAHGGTIRAENLPHGAGVRFAFELPDVILSNPVTLLSPTSHAYGSINSAESR